MAIDAWVNVNMGELGTPEYLLEAGRRLFKGGEEFFRDWSLEETLEMMDRSQVERALLAIDARRPSAHVLSFVARRPDRFALSAELDPRRGRQALLELGKLMAGEPVVLARIVPFYSGIPPSDALYYPVYARCEELGLPLGINTGIPGPPAPGDCQHPLHLDRVCIRFPELRLVMTHGADPWWEVAIRLMGKYRHLHLMTSAYLPRYLPESLLHFMDTRGRDKVIFASDHPAISTPRCLEEARRLPLRPEALEAYLHANAARLFFSGSPARAS